MAYTVLSILAAIVLTAVWTWWEERSGVDDEHEARQAAYMGRLVKRMLFAVALLTISLVLASLDVPGAAYVALVAVLALVVLFYVGPFVGPRRRRS